MAIKPKNLGASDTQFTRRPFIVTEKSASVQVINIAGSPVLPVGTPLTWVPGSLAYIPWVDLAQLDTVVTYGDTVDPVTNIIGLQTDAVDLVNTDVMRRGELEFAPTDPTRAAVLVPAGQTLAALKTALLALQDRRTGIEVRGLAGNS